MYFLHTFILGLEPRNTMLQLFLWYSYLWLVIYSRLILISLQTIPYHVYSFPQYKFSILIDMFHLVSRLYILSIIRCNFDTVHYALFETYAFQNYTSSSSLSPNGSHKSSCIVSRIWYSANPTYIIYFQYTMHFILPFEWSHRLRRLTYSRIKYKFRT